MIWRGDEYVIVTCWRFAKLRAEVDPFSIRIQNDLLGKTPVISQATMHGYCHPNAVYESTATNSLPPVLSKTGVSKICCSVVAPATSYTCFSLGSKARSLPSVRLQVLVFVPLSIDDSGTVIICIGCNLYGTIFHLMETVPLQTCRRRILQGERGMLSLWQSGTRRVCRTLPCVRGT